MVILDTYVLFFIEIQSLPNSFLSISLPFLSNLQNLSRRAEKRAATTGVSGPAAASKRWLGGLMRFICRAGRACRREGRWREYEEKFPHIKIPGGILPNVLLKVTCYDWRTNVETLVRWDVRMRMRIHFKASVMTYEVLTDSVWSNFCKSSMFEILDISSRQFNEVKFN